MSENWKPVENYPDYLVSDSGRICSLRTGLIKACENSRGYMLVHLDGKINRLHRVVAKAFIPNPEGKEMVNHKDGDPKNNKAENLEWNTNSENQTHRYSELNKANKRRPVAKMKDGLVVDIYDSISECERAERLAKDSLRDLIRKNVCRRGFYYKYVEDLENANY